MKQRHQRRRDVGVLRQHGDQVAARIGNAELPQIAGEGAQDLDVPPAQVRLGGELVEPVILGQIAPDREDGVLHPGGEHPGLEADALACLEHHVVDVDFAAAAGRRRVGVLVDHPEAEVLEHGHAAAERDRASQVIDLEADGALAAGQGPQPELDCLAGEPLDDLDVGKRLLGGVARLVGRRERLEEVLDGGLIAGGAAELVAEAEGKFGDLVLDFVAARPRRRAAIAAEDEVHADQIPFGEARIVGRDAPVIDPGQVVADPGAHLRIVAVAWHEQEDGDEIVEAVDAGEHADARPVGQLRDGGGELEELVVADLEQLLARIVLQRVHQRLAGMPLRVEARAAHHLADLLADQRHFRVRGGDRHRGEEAEDAQFASDIAQLVEELDPDIVHVGAPMYAGLQVGLSDHQRLGAGKKGDVLRRHLDIVGARPQEQEARILEDAQAAVLDRHQTLGLLLPLQPVLAHAQEGEIVLGQPAEKMHGLRQHCRHDHPGRRVVPGLHYVVHPFEHRPPAGDGPRHLGEHAVEFGLHLVAGFEVQRIDVDVQETFELAAGHRGIQDAVCRRVEVEDRVGEEPDGAALGPDGCQHAVDDEGHVDREDLDDLGEPKLVGGLEVDLVGGEFALSQPLEGAAQQVLDDLGGVGGKVLGIGGPGGLGEETREVGFAGHERIRPGQQACPGFESRRLVHGSAPLRKSLGGQCCERPQMSSGGSELEAVTRGRGARLP